MWYAKAEAVGSHKIEVNFAPGNGGKDLPRPVASYSYRITASAYNQHYGKQRSQDDILLKILAAVGSKRGT
jgi:hypothetical protein